MGRLSLGLETPARASSIRVERDRGQFLRKGLGEFEEEGPQEEREITLGSGLLAAVGGCILLLCGLCFWLGLSVGRQGAPPAMRAQAQAAVSHGDVVQGSVQGSSSKPVAAGSGPSAHQTPSQTFTAQSAGGNPSSAEYASTSPAPVQVQAASASQPQVKPALPAVIPASPAQSALPSVVQPAPGMGTGVMVQIAALSHDEDARVLMNALRQHGYNAFARRELSDGMIHVQIGPFASRSDAEAISRKLEGDGYNAEVQPQ